MKTKLLSLTAAVFLVASLSACTDQSEANRVLKMNGYTDIQYDGYGWFQCSESDTFATSFKAKSPTGETVKGTVCSGIFIKGSTIRF